MTFGLGVALFALGIAISVALHEAGHLLTAKALGMKVRRYFIGFGPSIFSFRRGETEYGLKAIPAGGFCKILGMTPLDDDLKPAEQHRAFWRFPVWKRTVVLAAGSAVHFLVAFLLVYLAVTAVGVPDDRARVGRVDNCVSTDPAAASCKAGKDPAAPAVAAGLRSGDEVVSVDGVRTKTWEDLVDQVRKRGGQDVTLVVHRDGATRTIHTTPISVERYTYDDSKHPKKTKKVGALGIAANTSRTYGPVAGIGASGHQFGSMLSATGHAITGFPAKVGKLFSALDGKPRDPNTPISVYGASRVGGQAIEAKQWVSTIGLLAALNMFIGVFNLMPLLPLDGGHVAVAWFERLRSWLASARRRPDPGRVDYNKLLPITYAVILVFGGVSLLTITADIVNPIANPFQ
ncbi:MAG: M50 family metallopeptidase [Catenulispora sp.]